MFMHAHVLLSLLVRSRFGSRGMMEVCGVICVVTEVMVRSRFGSRFLSMMGEHASTSTIPLGWLRGCQSHAGCRFPLTGVRAFLHDCCAYCCHILGKCHTKFAWVHRGGSWFGWHAVPLQHRYGLGAGPTPTWCSGSGAGYVADRITNETNQQACRFYSPYAVAGYAPVEPLTITTHLLELLATGESVVPIADARDTVSAGGANIGGGSGGAPPLIYEVLWRKSLLQRDPLITCPWGTCGITLVDFAAEFYGLASLQLSGEFFITHTNHFPTDPPGV
jgi:hypothetical protein